MKYSDSKFTVLGWIKGNFDVDWSLELITVIEDFTVNCVRNAGMIEKWIHIITAVPYQLISLFELKNESVWIIGHLN